MAEEPVAPSELLLRYRRFDNEGRLQTAPKRITGIPPECTVGELQQLVRESLNISPRQPVELLHWGRLLEPTLLLKNCSLSTHSELELYGKIAFATSSQSGDNSTVHCGRHCSPQVIARPRLQASAFTQGEPVKRVRLVSTKLQVRSNCVADGYEVLNLAHGDVGQVSEALKKCILQLARMKRVTCTSHMSAQAQYETTPSLYSLGLANAKRRLITSSLRCASSPPHIPFHQATGCIALEASMRVGTRIDVHTGTTCEPES
eukprot:2882706-Pleurochrysis_carterae.AAC.1